MTSSKNYTKVKVKSMFQSGKNQNNITSKGIVANRIWEDSEIFSDHKVCLDIVASYLEVIWQALGKYFSKHYISIVERSSS